MERTGFNPSNSLQGKAMSVASSTPVAGLTPTQDEPVSAPPEPNSLDGNDTIALASGKGQPSSMTSAPITLDRTADGVTSHYTFETAAEAAAFEKLLAEPAPTHVSQVLPPAPDLVDHFGLGFSHGAPNPEEHVHPPAPHPHSEGDFRKHWDRACPEKDVHLGRARELLRGGHVPYSTQSDAQIRWTLGHKRRNEWTAQDYAAYLKVNEKPRMAVDDSINPVLYPGHNIRRSISADTTLAMPFMIPEGGIAMNIMVALTTGVAPLDGSTRCDLPDWCISTTPGDFTENVVPNGTSIGGGGRLDVNTPPLPPTDLGNALTTNSIILEPGKTYYLNFRSKSPDEGTAFVMQTHSNMTSAYTGTPTVSGLPGFLNGVDLNLGKQLEYPSLRNF